MSRLICRADGPYGCLELHEDAESRWIKYAGGAVQSRMRLASPETLALPYTRAMATALLFVDGPAAALLLGLGGGSLVRFLRKHQAPLDITAVERDGSVITIAREFFELPEDGPGFRVVQADARRYVATPGSPVDLVFADLFDGHGLPDWMRDVPFYAACRNRLNPGGVLVANLWVEEEDEHLQVTEGIRSAFDGRVLMVTLEGYRNLVVLAFERPPPRLDFRTLYERAQGLAGTTKIDFPSLLTGMRDTNPIDERGFVL